MSGLAAVKFGLADEVLRPQVAVARQIGLRQFVLADRCLLYTSDAADERSSVDLGGRRII